METRKPTVYMMASKINGTLYAGVTSDLARRVAEHKKGTASSFSSKYHCTLLVWYSSFETMTDAIYTEKFLKRRTRTYKIQLIEEVNPSWNDLYANINQL